MPHVRGTPTWNANTSQGYVDKRGYRWVYVTENGIRHARREHRVVMEQKLGRRLVATEVVHHINGDKADNCAENLEILGHGDHTSHHHTGSERSDLAKKRMATAAKQREEIAKLRGINAELLAALKSITNAVENHGQDWLFEFVSVSRAAIAKAEGRA